MTADRHCITWSSCSTITLNVETTYVWIGTLQAACLTDVFNPVGKQASSAFVSGYLVLLFCKLMQGDMATRDMILGRSEAESRRHNLVSVLEDFQVILRKTNEKIQDQLGGDDVA